MGQISSEWMTALGKRRGFLTLLGLGTAAVYLAMGQHQEPEYVVITMMFLVFAAYQLLLALMTLFAPGRPIFALGFVGNLMLLVTSIGSHILGLPFGAHPSTPHILGSAEMSVLIMKIFQVILYFKIVV
jgi:hypothetical protein